jgi:hypothetical protein
VAIRILLDENIAPAIRTAVLQLDATIDILRVGDADAPPTGTKDPDILRYLEISQRVMVTDNRRSIPEHIADHHAAAARTGGFFGFVRACQSENWPKPSTFCGLPASTTNGATRLAGFLCNLYTRYSVLLS